MATLADIYSLITGAPSLEQRFIAARVKAAWDVLNEDAGTTNHVNRLAWAKATLDDPTARKSKEYLRFLSNTTIQSSGVASTDNDVQFVVNSLLDGWATDLAGV
jgi:hypothetical protein